MKKKITYSVIDNLLGGVIADNLPLRMAKMVASDCNIASIRDGQPDTVKPQYVLEQAE